jgi:tetratricopeptide (TPR) repeat protein
MRAFSIAVALLVVASTAHADSINSPNAFGIIPSDAGDALAVKRLQICEDPRRPPDDRIEACQSLLHRHLTVTTELWIQIGLAYDEKRDAANAIDAYTQAYMSGGKVSALEHRALTYAWSGRYDLALADSAELFDLAGQHGALPPALANRCLLRAVAGKDLDAAIADCDQAIAQEPTNTTFAFDRGLALLKAGKTKDALAIFDKLAESHAAARYLRGIAEVRLDNEAAGRADIAEATALNRRIADLYDRYGVKAP